jgi:hypothetical protein
MTFRVEVVCLHDGGEQRCSVAELERAELALETFGMSVAEGKAILHGVQDESARKPGVKPPSALPPPVEQPDETSGTTAETHLPIRC